MRTDTAIGALSLFAIVACSLVIVLIAADRPSLLASTTTPHFFPGWMAGPLGGLWPSLTRDSNTLRYLFTGALGLMYVSYLAGIRYVPRLSARWAIAAVVAVHAIMFLSPPLALTDVFNYINYGRMEIVHHLNPYTTTPILEPHTDPSFTLSNWHELLSPYGPIFTLITFIVVPLGVAASFWALKALLMFASLGIVLLVWHSAKLLGRDPVKAIVLAGLNPIVLIWGLGGDHNDFLMMFCVMLGFYLLLRANARAKERQADGDEAGGGEATVGEAGRGEAGRGEAGGGEAGVDEAGVGGGGVVGAVAGWSPALLGAGAAFVGAVSIKASAAILLPVVLAAMLHRRRELAQVVVGMVGAGIVLGTASLIAFGAHFPDLATQGRLVTMYSLPNLLGVAIGLGGETTGMRVLLSAVLVLAVLGCSVYAWRRRESITAAGWASFALLATLSWVLPWYVLWILPLAALSSSRRLRVATLVLGAYFILAWAPTSSLMFKAIGFHPEKTALGRLHQRYVRELLY